MQSIGIIGAGLMGSGMASCLLRAGHSVTVLANRNRTPVETLVRQGAIEADSAETLVKNCDVLLTCLPNADVVRSYADRLVPLFRDGQIWIDTTTSLPETSAKIGAALAEKGAIFVDAPVTGGPPQAADGKLASMVGCEEAHFAQVQSLIQPYSTVIRRFGDVGRGHAAKLLNNLVTQGTTILLADAYQTANTYGIDTEALFDVMMTGAARSGTLEKSVKPSLTGNYKGASFSIENAAKDLRYAAALLEQIDPARSDVVRVLRDRLAAVVAAGHGKQYVSEMLDPSMTLQSKKDL